MPICPNGHTSQTTDYCDYCGAPMTAQPQQPAAGQPWQQHAPSAPAPATPTAGLPVCPICATPRTGRYCEECGYDWDLAPAAAGQGAAPVPAPSSVPGQQPMGQPGMGQPGMGQQPMPAPAPQPQYGQPGQAPQGLGQPQPAPAEPVSGPVVNGGGYASYITGDTNGGNTEYMLAPPSQGGPAGAAPAQDPFGPPSSSVGQPQQGAPGYRGTWIAVVTADRDYFQDMMARSGPEASGLYFPPYSPERRVPMTGQGQLRIGRRSHQRGTVPEIDLSIAPEDPGASHNHALLQEQPGGSWVVIDQDSTNGTSLNGSPDPLPAFTPVELKNGDRIHVGAWTTITVHCA
ncbi:FHA domain-containing protein [Streptacidiphilus pinicola]|uniref:FHA domain-containing protein n=1 Tax=Streptacidiphilus pinicola TaxID=2219663 RepID=A0A2X0K5C1_9ACTN|nr:FHA domain-containing protein [Streptacidiphilus pinicola]RAG82769.1 FHA domain-containing protein [Streptacidiphilus pinicola]